jgi:hypothetical protein
MQTTSTPVLPHAVAKDDEYVGYLIPNSAAVLNSVYAIHHDATPTLSKQDTFTLDAGRRICVGMDVVERSFVPGRLAEAFGHSKSRPLWAGLPVKVLMPDPEKLAQGFVGTPEQYAATITPRSPDKAEFIRYEWELVHPLYHK